jgi:hypothetical protein
MCQRVFKLGKHTMESMVTRHFTGARPCKHLTNNVVNRYQIAIEKVSPVDIIADEARNVTDQKDKGPANY